MHPAARSAGFLLIYRIYVQISHTSEKHDKWRTLGSEIVFILKRVNSENTLHFSACMPKRPYYLVKKVISCNRSVHSSRLRISDFYAKLVKRLNQRSQQDGFLSSRAMLSQPYIVSTVFFRKASKASCKKTWSFSWKAIKVLVIHYTIQLCLFFLFIIINFQIFFFNTCSSREFRLW